MRRTLSKRGAQTDFKRVDGHVRFLPSVGASEPSAKHPLKRGINAADQLLGAKLLGDRARLFEEFSRGLELSRELAQQSEIGEALRQQTGRVGRAGMAHRLFEMPSRATLGPPE